MESVQPTHSWGLKPTSHPLNVQVPATAMSWGSPSLGCFPQTSPPNIVFAFHICGSAHHLVQGVKSEQCLMLSLQSRKQNFCFLLKIWVKKNLSSMRRTNKSIGTNNGCICDSRQVNPLQPEEEILAQKLGPTLSFPTLLNHFCRFMMLWGNGPRVSFYSSTSHKIPQIPC